MALDGLDRKTFLLKEVDIIQDIIRRMAANSFAIKGWTLTLVVVALLLNGKTRVQAGLAFIPLLVFWGLDAFYLRQERLYRALYSWIVTHQLDNDEHLLDMDACRFKGDVASVPVVMFSRTIWPFYLAIVALVVAYGLLVLKK